MAVYVPTGHGEHATAPVAVLNVPSKHAVHATPLDAAVYPTKHVQSESDALTAGELVACGQVEHAVAPRVLVYVPTGQGAHVV